MELLVRVLACLAEGWGMRATARVCEADPNTGRHWLVGAEEYLRAFSVSFLVLAACGWTINSACIERRAKTLCRGEAGLRDQLALFQVYHNFGLPQASLRQPLATPRATHGSSVKVGQPCTPAMAAGVTDHVWTRQAV
ncbi:MAG: hypothetical protein AB7N91_15840 [Candidatus Tectimicrobiota bacterium]